jgi:hypothetical protein
MSISNISSVATGNTAAIQPAQTSASKKLAQDFTALTQALNSSDGSSAKDAFANLLQDLMSQTGATQKHHHLHHHGGGAQQVAGAGTTTATAATSATPSVGGRINTTA